MRRLIKSTRSLLVLALLFGAITAAGDYVLLHVAQSSAASAIAKSLAASSVDVKLGSYPILPSLLGGSIRDVDVIVTGAAASGLRVEKIVAKTKSLSFDRSDALALLRSRYATRTTLSFEMIDARVTVNETDLGDFVKSKIRSIKNVRISPAGVEIIFDFGEGVSARFFPKVENTKLTLTLVRTAGLPKEVVGLAQSIEGVLDLPPVPLGLQGQVELGQQNFVVALSGDTAKLDVGEGR